MADINQIYKFAIKWCDKFRDQKIDYIKLVDHYMADDCAALGFEMDSSHAFSEKYGDAFFNYKSLKKIIDEVDDIPLLGSAIYSQWRYFNHWAYSGAEILEFENRSWFILALSRLALLSGDNPFIFQGIPKKIRIVSNSICCGIPPKQNDEIEQRITINSEGRVWFSAYNFGKPSGRYQKGRSRIFKIEKAVVERVLNTVSAYFSGEYEELFTTDIGDWVMEITNTEGVVYKFRGPLCADFVVDGIDLSDLIRGTLGMDDLYVFDGNHKPDRVDRITVDYNRTTLIKSQEPALEGMEYATWNYSEKLVLDRKSEIIEHIQNIGTGCVVSRKLYVEGGIKGLLDDIDTEKLFGEIEGTPDDVIETPLETKNYTITVDFKKGPQRVIQGTYDKKALPDAWGNFADAVRNFISFYGFGEILDPSVYGKVRRSIRDYIYCSVEFDGGYRSYYYIADDDSIEIGDHVVVPAGKDNHYSVAEVVNVEFFSEDDVPFPIEKTKHIIRKCRNTEPDLIIEQGNENTLL